MELQVRLEEAKNRTLETQLRLAELEAGRSNGTTSNSSFDLGKASRLVPNFNEGSVDTFFSSFERLATCHKWPKDQWTLLLQQSFKGKALSTTNSEGKVCWVVK